MQFASITKRVANLGSEKWLPHLRAKKMAEIDPNVILLTIGQPDIAVSSELTNIAIESINKGRTGYSNGRGEQKLVGSLVNKYNNECEIRITEDNVLCFPGTQTSLFASIMGLINEGDEVLLGDPLYATYEGVIAAAGGTIKRIELKKDNNFRMSPSDLASSVTSKSKVLLLNNPHNPSGAILTKRDIEGIVDVCLQRDLWILSDEVYASLIYDLDSPAKFYSPLNVRDALDRTVVVSSISKSHAAPGFRSGWMVGPKNFCDAVLPLSETMLFGNQPFIADMTAYALENDFHTAKKMRDSYYKRAVKIYDVLKKNNKVEPIMPQSGMFLLADISKTGLSSDIFVKKLLEKEKLALMPGSSFGKNARDLVRISLTVPDEKIELSCKRLNRFIEGII